MASPHVRNARRLLPLGLLVVLAAAGLSGCIVVPAAYPPAPVYVAPPPPVYVAPPPAYVWGGWGWRHRYRYGW
ncbi:MAG TPA: hypothetical protein VGW35_17150 [Methylomirabilota bacterium]|jgi:hypothetical protein|nr:hypothetical protein [Methylomirabilota bacterium]